MEKVISYVIENRILKKLVLSKSSDKEILRTTGRLIEIKGEVCLALESFMTDGKAIQKNYNETEAVEKICELVSRTYKQANIITTQGDAEIKVSKKGKITVIDKIKKDVQNKVQLEKNNRDKNYIIPDGEPVDFLIELGVQDKNGRIFDKKRSKFRQINRFLELVSDVESEIIKGKDLYILDLCCGKSYLIRAILSQEKFKNYEDYLYISGDDGYHLYVGVTKDKKIASKIKDYYKEKGYINAEVNVMQQVDTVVKNAVRVTFEIKRGDKVKIKKITFEGNNDDVKDGKIISAMANTRDMRFRNIFKRLNSE